MSIAPNSPILVTGCHRSGTTWLGNLLAASPEVGYISEVFNLDHPMPGACAARFPHQYMHLTEENGREYVRPLGRTLGFRFDWADAWRALRTPRRLRRLPQNAAQFQAARRRGLRPLLKDPIAFFSAEWLARTFGMQVVVAVRHPGGLAASLKRLGYGFDFREFLDQPALMRDHLGPYRAEIEAFAAQPPPIVDQAGLLWRCVYGTAARLRKVHPEWQFVRHEDLSLRPHEELEPICGGWGSPLTTRSPPASPRRQPPPTRPTPRRAGRTSCGETAPPTSTPGGAAWTPTRWRGCGRSSATSWARSTTTPAGDPIVQGAQPRCDWERSGRRAVRARSASRASARSASPTSRSRSAACAARPAVSTCTVASRRRR